MKTEPFKSGSYKQQYQYKSFTPTPVNKPFAWETAANSKQTFEKIIELRRVCEEKILQLGKRAANGQALLRSLYSHPAMSANEIAARLGVTHQSASSLIKAFEEIKILREITGRKKDRLFVFSEYLGLFTAQRPRRPGATRARRTG